MLGIGKIGHMVGRIPIMDVAPVVDLGRYPAKAVVGEPFEVTALVFREGHDALSADVVLTDPDGERRPWVRMTKDPEEPDLWRAEISADREGAWTFSIEGWSDPVATWRHAAEIKIPAEIDVELMFAEGVLLLERVAASLPTSRWAGLPPSPRPSREPGSRAGRWTVATTSAPSRTRSRP